MTIKNIPEEERANGVFKLASLTTIYISPDDKITNTY